MGETAAVAVMSPVPEPFPESEAMVEGVANPVGLASWLAEGLPDTDSETHPVGLEAAEGVGEAAAVAVMSPVPEPFPDPEAAVEGVANPVGLASWLAEGLPDTDCERAALTLEAAEGVGEAAAVALQLL